MFGMASDPFYGRKILVTGASRPLGRAIARDLAGRGALVVALDIDQGGLADLARETAGCVEVRLADTANPAEAAEIATWLRSAHGNIVGLIACPVQNGATLAADLAARIARLIRPNPSPFAALVTDTPTNLAAPFCDRSIRLTRVSLAPTWLPADCDRMASRLLDAIRDGGRSLSLRPDRCSPVSGLRPLRIRAAA